jgi:hypothetical protein
MKRGKFDTRAEVPLFETGLKIVFPKEQLKNLTGQKYSVV